MNQQLWNAPPRICDLPPDELRQALLARDAQRREDWLRNRQHRSFWQRITARWAA